ncbi:pyridoxal phosphate-dependent transferase [Panaeolus papilionaceus]|nr:pyridoxal phosphate-dependent transferase [Panaeolus papilionaceus]
MTSSLGFRLSRGALTTAPPPIPKAYEWASQYVPKPNRPLLDMSQGVPGVPPPPIVQSALGAAASSPASFGYSRWDGEPALRKALANEIRYVYGAEADRDVDVTEDDVAFTAGCNLAFVASAMCVADAGDEIILPVPWYFNHQMTLNMLGIHTVGLPTRAETGFVPSVDECRQLITPKTRAIVLISPNNPTGAVYPPPLISSFADLAREKGVALIMDETYRDFLVNPSDPTQLAPPPHSLFSSSSSSPNSSWRSTFIHLFSFSKSYCLPGHRLGLIIASPQLLQNIKSILDTLQICSPRPIQQALAPLLVELRPFIREQGLNVDARHRLFRDNLTKEEGGRGSKGKWKVGAQGGYFAFVKHPFRRVGAEDVSRRLAKEVGVVCLPGTFFGPSSSSPLFSVSAANTSIGETQEEWAVCERSEDVDEDERWIRFSVANVDDARVRGVCERLRECVGEFGWEVDVD